MPKQRRRVGSDADDQRRRQQKRVEHAREVRIAHAVVELEGGVRAFHGHVVPLHAQRRRTVDGDAKAAAPHGAQTPCQGMVARLLRHAGGTEIVAAQRGQDADGHDAGIEFRSGQRQPRQCRVELPLQLAEGRLGIKHRRQVVLKVVAVQFEGQQRIRMARDDRLVEQAHPPIGADNVEFQFGAVGSAAAAELRVRQHFAEHCQAFLEAQGETLAFRIGEADLVDR